MAVWTVSAVISVAPLHEWGAVRRRRSCAAPRCGLARLAQLPGSLKFIATVAVVSGALTGVSRPVRARAFKGHVHRCAAPVQQLLGWCNDLSDVLAPLLRAATMAVHQ